MELDREDKSRSQLNTWWIQNYLAATGLMCHVVVETLTIGNMRHGDSIQIFTTFESEVKDNQKPKTTFNGGSLGSCIDEERSELRYVM